MNEKPFRYIDRLRSFAYAWSGLGVLLRTQHNAWIHAVATVLVIGVALYVGVNAYEWLWLVLAMALVWMAEAFNTALELLADAITREQHPLIGRAKDVAAGAVLIAALGALIIGALVLGPHLLQRLA